MTGVSTHLSKAKARRSRKNIRSSRRGRNRRNPRRKSCPTHSPMRQRWKAVFLSCCRTLGIGEPAPRTKRPTPRSFVRIWGIGIR